MSNTSNAITALTNMKSVITAAEAGSLFTGIPEIDAETRRLLTTRDDLMLAVIFDGGSRAQQNAAATARAAANGGLAHAQDPQYWLIDLFTRAIDAQIAVLNNPAQTSRRSQPALK